MRERRTDLQEMMDDPACDRNRLFATYRHFRWMNPLLGNWKHLIKREILPYFQAKGQSHIKVLDIGCGGGDVLRYVHKELQLAGLQVQSLGIDPDPNAAFFWKEEQLLHQNEGIDYLCGHSSELDTPFDLILSNHVLHHLPDSITQNFADECSRLNAGLCLLNDLQRAPLAYAAYTGLAWPLHWNSFAWIDGRRSILRAYKTVELQRLLGDRWQVRSHGLFRLVAKHYAKE